MLRSALKKQNTPRHVNMSVKNPQALVENFDTTMKDHTMFLKNLCLSTFGGAKSVYAKQWNALTPAGRLKLETSLKHVSAEIVNQNKVVGRDWTSQIASYFDVLLEDLEAGNAPKAVLFSLPARHPKKTSSRNFVDDHSDARCKMHFLSTLLYHKSVAKYGHRAVNYTSSFSKLPLRRGLDVYGYPREAPFKVRIVYAMDNTITSRKFFAARPYEEEAILTVIIGRTSPPRIVVKESDLVLLKVVPQEDTYRVKENVQFGLYHARLTDKSVEPLPKSVGYFYFRRVAYKRKVETEPSEKLDKKKLKRA